MATIRLLNYGETANFQIILELQAWKSSHSNLKYLEEKLQYFLSILIEA